LTLEVPQQGARAGVDRLGRGVYNLLAKQDPKKPVRKDSGKCLEKQKK